ncbi:hypothetical protein ACNVED_03380 [Legionella sp. D16C41]|uniref:hypothetical protein n=1 Tax=Legionella sp. D16C41 TaxID=3402688 RepID=UPI003AF4D922
MSMSNFEIAFLRTFYKSFINVLNPTKLHIALKQFQTNVADSNSKRHSGIQTFGLIDWQKQDAEKFTAAIAEALAATTEQFMDTQDLDSIQAITDTLRNEYIPELIKRLNPHNPFEDLARQLQFDLEQLAKQEENVAIFNKYSFFGGAAVIALGAAIIYDYYNPRQ